MTKLKVSICMITYNHERFIEEAITGVLMQEVDFEVELIIADDCSPDNTEDIVSDVMRNHPHGNWIRYTRHRENKGVNANFKWALEQCRGNYIALCEGDDYWTDKGKLQNQVQLLEEKGTSAFGCFHPVRRHHNRGDDDYYTDQQFEPGKSGYYLKDLLQPWFLGTASLVIRRDQILIPDWFDQVPSADIALVLSSIRDGYLVCYPEIAGVWRVHSGGVSATHSGPKKVMDMAVLYHHINGHYDGRYSEEILKAIEQEIHLHINRKRERDLKGAIKDGRVLTASEHVAALLKKIRRRLSLRSK